MAKGGRRCHVESQILVYTYRIESFGITSKKIKGLPLHLSLRGQRIQLLFPLYSLAS